MSDLRQIAFGYMASKALLDVGGGTGAVTIDLLQQVPDLRSTIIDFPNVVALGRNFASQAGVADRMDYIEDNALRVEWPTDQDVVLMSYLCISVKGEDNPALLLGSAISRQHS